MINNQPLNIDLKSLLWIPGNLGVFWKDCHGNYMGCNDVVAEKTRLSSRHDVVGKNDFDLVELALLRHDEAQTIRDGDRIVLQSRQPQCFLYSATGSLTSYIFLTMKAPLWNQDSLTCFFTKTNRPNST